MVVDGGVVVVGGGEMARDVCSNEKVGVSTEVGVGMGGILDGVVDEKLSGHVGERVVVVEGRMKGGWVDGDELREDVDGKNFYADSHSLFAVSPPLPIY